MQRRWYVKQNIVANAYAKYMPSFICPITSTSLSEGEYNLVNDLGLEPKERRLRM